MAKEPKLTNFVKRTIEELSGGLPKNHRVDSRLFFELSVLTSVNKKGGIDIKVASGDISSETQNLQKIKFSVVNEISEKKDMAMAKKGLKNLFSSIAEIAKKYPELAKEK